MRYVKIGAVALASLLLAAAAFIVAADRLGQPSPPDRAALMAKAAQYDVRIKRDTYGVPHIFGATDADVAFGLGFAHSEDDFATIQEVAIATRGELAAIRGPEAAVTDYLVRLMRVWETVEARYESDLPADVRAVMEAYADGVNSYAALHEDDVERGLLPLTGKDIAAGFVFKTPFFYGLDQVLKRIADPEADEDKPETGSNGVAVAPSRSADGATRLLVNSHQPYAGAVAWYEAVLESGQGWHVAGGFFPGTPFMLHGHNAHLGWANTVNKPDLVDVYRLTVNPDDEDQYLLDGTWHDFEKTDAAIRVKLWGPFVWTFHRDVLWSAHGPVLKTDRGAFAVRYAGMNEVRHVLQYYRLNKARDLGEWRAAMALQALPSINYIYADAKGNIGYVYNGQFPIRKAGLDWLGMLPGEHSDLIWQSYLPFDAVPQLWNPPSGFVFNANNAPFRATDGRDDLGSADFAPTLGIQTNMTNRAWRALETYGADASITAEEFRAYKFDLAYSPRSELVASVGEILAADAGGDADFVAGQEILRNWDFRTDAANRNAALGVLTGMPAIRARIEGVTPPPAMEAFKTAMATLKSLFGRLDPAWGDVNRMRRGGVDLAIDGGPDVLRAVYGVSQPDGTLSAVAGDTLIMFVTWDKDGVLSSESIHQFGSATLDEGSPHYADQTSLFVAMKTKPVWFTQQDLADHVAEDYRPGERN